MSTVNQNTDRCLPHPALCRAAFEVRRRMTAVGYPAQLSFGHIGGMKETTLPAKGSAAPQKSREHTIHSRPVLNSE